MEWFKKPSIPREIRKREIDTLMHSTHVTINLPQIFQDGFIDTARGLRSRLGERAERLLHDPRRFESFAVGHDYINCSVTVPNYELLYARSKSAWSSEWAHLILNIELLEQEETLFCAVCAAQENGKHVQCGPCGFVAMFDERVAEWDRTGLVKNEPTHPQAEVLVHGARPLSSVVEILVGDGQTAMEVERLASFYKRQLRVRVEPRLFVWPERLKKRAT